MEAHNTTNPGPTGTKNKVYSILFPLLILLGIGLYLAQCTGKTPKGIEPSRDLLEADLFSFKFSIEGKELQFPLTVGDLQKALGWSVKSRDSRINMDSKVNPHSVVLNDLLRFTDYGRNIYFEAANDTDQELTFSECNITKILFNNNNWGLEFFKRTCTLILPKGITMAEKSSTREEVLAAYGQPDGGSENILEYIRGNTYIRFIFLPNRPALLSIDVKAGGTVVYDLYD